MLTDIRLLSHQLAKPRFRSPKELVAWMGAVQAQELIYVCKLMIIKYEQLFGLPLGSQKQQYYPILVSNRMKIKSFPYISYNCDDYSLG